jgi:hypothetical protein
MTKLMTAAVLAVLTLSPVAFADEPAKAAQEKKEFTIPELGTMLDEMGYGPRESKDKDGKVTGYYVDMNRDGSKVTCFLTVSGGTTVWFDNTLLVFDDKTPATLPVVLGLLAEQDNLWPAYIVHYPKTNKLVLAQAVTGPDVSRKALRDGLESFMDKWVVVKNTYQKVLKEEAIAREKAEKEGDKE